MNGAIPPHYALKAWLEKILPVHCTNYEGQVTFSKLLKLFTELSALSSVVELLM